MSLKKITQSKHSNAERSWFAGLMMSGKISNNQYSVYLKQQYECYNALETRFNNSNGLSLPESLKRSNNIMEDLKELNSDIKNIPVFDSTQTYIDYILNDCNSELLYAHVYVR
jgi:heme oxygenase